MKISDYQNIEYFQLEQEGFEELLEKLKKDPYDYEITVEDFNEIAKHFHRFIIVHKQDMKSHKCFGDIYNKK